MNPSPASYLARDVRAWIGQLCAALDVSPSELAEEAGLSRAKLAYILWHARDDDGIQSAMVLALEQVASTAREGSTTVTKAIVSADGNLVQVLAPTFALTLTPDQVDDLIPALQRARGRR